MPSSSVGEIRLNVGDTPGIRNWGRVRIDCARPDGTLEGTCLDANGGQGCPCVVTPEQWDTHFVHQPRP